jgi:hypothetical protein
MKIIQLRSDKYPGYETIVDNEDYEILITYGWNPVIETKNNTVYVQVRIGTAHIRMHRFIMHLHGYDIEKKLIDHKDRNGLNNQKENLRICTHSKNMQNSNKTRSTTTSDFKGVSFVMSRKKYQSTITLNGKQLFLGYFHSEIDAALAYNEKAIELFGEFANLNIIEL